jgi:hypothetical protein
MSLDVPLSEEIEQLRAKIRDNTITQEEMRSVIARIRQGRMSAAESARKSPSRVKAPSGEELLDDLLG